MKEYELLKTIAKMTPKHRELFARLTVAYLNGEFTREQLFACKEGTEIYEELKHRYADSQVD